MTAAQHLLGLLRSLGLQKFLLNSTDVEQQDKPPFAQGHQDAQGDAAATTCPEADPWQWPQQQQYIAFEPSCSCTTQAFFPCRSMPNYYQGLHLSPCVTIILVLLLIQQALGNIPKTLKYKESCIFLRNCVQGNTFAITFN